MSKIVEECHVHRPLLHSEIRLPDRIARQHLGRRARGADGAGLQQVGAIDHGSTCCTFCSTISTVSPLARMRFTSSKTCCTTTGARPADGSSSSSSLGPLISARPMAHICCSPPDIVPASCLRRSFMRGNRSNTNSIRSANAARASGMKAPIFRLSSTVSRGNSRRFSGTWAMPRPTMRCAGVASTSVPSIAIEPRARPDQSRDHAHQRRLAGAVGADHADRLARVDFELDAEQRLEAGVARVDAFSSSIARPVPPRRPPRPGSPGHRCRDRPRSPWVRATPHSAGPRRSSRHGRSP